MAQSGGLFEATRFAAPCEITRTTISNYLKVLEATFVAPVIRPFSPHRPTEIVSAPRSTDLIVVLWPTSAAGRIFDGRILV